MDLSKLIWPLVIALIVGMGWLVSSPGINYMYGKYTASVPGEDLERDKQDEAGLTRIAGFLFKIMRHSTAKGILQAAVDRYPDGANVWYNYYRLAKCKEKEKDYAGCVEILAWLRSNNANQHDNRVPVQDILNLRMQKLIETHELPPRD